MLCREDLKQLLVGETTMNLERKESLELHAQYEVVRVL